MLGHGAAAPAAQNAQQNPQNVHRVCRGHRGEHSSLSLPVGSTAGSCSASHMVLGRVQNPHSPIPSPPCSLEAPIDAVTGTETRLSGPLHPEQTCTLFHFPFHSLLSGGCSTHPLEGSSRDDFLLLSNHSLLLFFKDFRTVTWKALWMMATALTRRKVGRAHGWVGAASMGQRWPCCRDPEGISAWQGDPTVGLRGLAGTLAVLVAVVGTGGHGPASPRYSYQQMPGCPSAPGRRSTAVGLEWCFLALIPCCADPVGLSPRSSWTLSLLSGCDRWFQEQETSCAWLSLHREPWY